MKLLKVMLWGVDYFISHCFGHQVVVSRAKSILFVLPRPPGERAGVRGQSKGIPLIPAFSPQGRRRKYIQMVELHFFRAKKTRL